MLLLLNSIDLTTPSWSPKCPAYQLLTMVEYIILPLLCKAIPPHRNWCWNCNGLQVTVGYSACNWSIVINGAWHTAKKSTLTWHQDIGYFDFNITGYYAQWTMSIQCNKTMSALTRHHFLCESAAYKVLSRQWEGRCYQILKLRLQYFGHLMRREDSLEKTLMLGKSEGKRRKGRQRTRWFDSVIEATNMNLTQLREAVKDRRAWRALVHGVMKSRT